MIDIVGNRRWFFITSAVVIVAGIISLATIGLKLGIEFESGSMMTVNFEQEITESDLADELTSLGYGSVIIQSFEESGDFLLRLPALSVEEKDALIDSLAERFGDFSEAPSFDRNVDPMVASETGRNTFWAVLGATVGILIYVTWAFHRMPNPIRWGTCAIIALVHDALVALGIFSIFGYLLGWEIDLMFVTGVLAVVGYSVNDTVVIFDRIRENMTKYTRVTFKDVVNRSLVETLSRSLNTSLTTLFVVLALQLFVGESIQNFTIVLIIGIITGTYSSLCIAPEILIAWEKGEFNKFFRWLPRRPGR
jgi:preprotein translocase subunit SecF